MSGISEAPWTHAKIARDMAVGERAEISFGFVDWKNQTVDLDGLVFRQGVRTPTNAIWRTGEDTWLIIRPDLAQMIWLENPSKEET
jgi:hypothetical protein